MLRIVLPATDAGALAQLIFTVAIGVPALVFLIRRRATELGWLVGGLLLFVLSFFAFRAVH